MTDIHTLPPHEALTEREVDVLHLLAEELTNRQIADRLVLSTQTVKWYVKQIYRKLGIHSRAEAIDIARQQRFALVDTDELPEHNLPAIVTVFVGRQPELAQIAELLRASRLVTITGPGGIGKTRTAAVVGHRLLADFADGVTFVGLDAIANPQQISSSIGEALKLKDADKASLIDHLRRKQMLLILDNFEHVIEGAPIVSEILAASAEVRVLATSREPLHLNGEHEYTLGPLQTPSPSDGLTPDQLAAYEAPTLFDLRARAVKADFRVTRENAAAVAAICKRLDGLPLAIELAAARIKFFSPQELLTMLDTRLGVLMHGARDLPERQQTLRSAIAWSYNLLDRDERTLFAELAVLHGGATLEAAQHIVALDGHVVALGLQSLADKSLLTVSRGVDGITRFGMLETIHEFASEKLREADTEDEVSLRHLDYFHALAEQAYPKMRSADELGWIKRLNAEAENIRTALAWSLANEEYATNLAIIGCLGYYWHVQGKHYEGKQWVQAALQHTDKVPPEVLPRAYLAASSMAFLKAPLDNSASFAEKALEVAEAVGDQRSSALAKAFIGAGAIGKMEGYQTDIALCRQALAEFEQAGYKAGMAQALNIMGEIYRMAGVYDEATIVYEQALELVNDYGGPQRVVMLHHNLALIDIYTGRLDDAWAHLRTALELGREIDNPIMMATVLMVAAGYEAYRGTLQKGVMLLAAATHLFSEMNAAPQPGDADAYQHFADLLQANLDAQTYAAAYAAGEVLSLDEAVTLALGFPKH